MSQSLPKPQMPEVLPIGALAIDFVVFVVQVLVIIELGLSWTNGTISTFEMGTLFIVSASLVLTLMGAYLTFFPTRYFQYSTIMMRLVSNALLAVSHVHLATGSQTVEPERRTNIYKGDVFLTGWPILLIVITILTQAQGIGLLTMESEALRLRRGARGLSRRASKIRKKVSSDLFKERSRKGFSAGRKSLKSRARARVAPAPTSKMVPYASNF